MNKLMLRLVAVGSCYSDKKKTKREKAIFVFATAVPTVIPLGNGHLFPLSESKVKALIMQQHGSQI